MIGLSRLRTPMHGCLHVAWSVMLGESATATRGDESTIPSRHTWPMCAWTQVMALGLSATARRATRAT